MVKNSHKNTFNPKPLNPERFFYVLFKTSIFNMNHKIQFLLSASLFFINSLATATTKRVLFIGNSYTYVNDLPDMLAKIALSSGDTILYDVSTPGGHTFMMHTSNTTTQSKIKAGNWDYVILQEQSQLPSFSPAQVATDVLIPAKTLCDTIKAYNPCAEIIFYMTWGRKNGDAGNCASYPPVCTYAGMQQRLRESYILLSDTNNATLAPVGAVWSKMRTQYPSVELYSPDESHPSIQGTYLAAATFYSLLYRKHVDSTSYIPASLNLTEAQQIKQIVHQVVLDSLEYWYQYGALPIADFSFLVSANTVSFQNLSKRFDSQYWDFGDGSTDTSYSPTHVYLTPSFYNVSLKVINNNCIYDSVNYVVEVLSPSQVISFPPLQTSCAYSIKSGVWQNPFYPSKSSVRLLSPSGQIILSQIIEKEADFNSQHLPKGRYILQFMGTHSYNRCSQYIWIH